MKYLLLAFLQERGLKNMATPAGTVFQRTSTVREWPEDAALLTWAKAAVPSAIRTKEDVDKRAVVEHIRATGEIPAGFREWPETTLQIRKA